MWLQIEMKCNTRFLGKERREQESNVLYSEVYKDKNVRTRMAMKP
jgi:hypothetical protein